MSEKVIVSIMIEERIFYSAEVEMTQEQFDDFERRLDDADGDENSIAQELRDFAGLSIRDAQPMDDAEVTDFTIVEYKQEAGDAK